MPFAALTLLAMLTATPELRREQSVDFPVDEAFQSDGGVQFFYAFEPTLAVPPKGSAWSRFLALDDKAKPTDSFHAVMSRIVYTVERDVSYFTAARAKDTGYLAAVAPQMRVSEEKDGSFRVGRMPSNRFELTWHDAPEPTHATLEPFFSFLPPGVRPTSVVVQHNSDFARVMGMRTAERSITYTAHVAIAPGRTRIHVCTVSLLHHVPPFFLGGKDRVYREAVDETAALIEALREYRGP